MIVRLVLAAGVALVIGAWLLMVPMSPPPYQGSSASLIAAYRAEGLVPERNAMTMSSEIGHDVFEIPAADAVHLAAILAEGAGAAGMESMHGMDMPMPDAGHDEGPAQAMGSAEGGHDASSMPGMAMPAEGGPGGPAMEGMIDAAKGETPGDAHGGGAMETAEGEHHAPSMPGMAMPAGGGPAGPAMEEMIDAAKGETPGDAHGGGAMETAEGEHHAPSMPGMAMPASEEAGHGEKPAGTMDMAMAMGHGEQAGGHSGGDGLAILTGGMAKMAGRTIEIEMAEWGFSPASVTVKTGEVVRLSITNRGNIPHEFMFMSGAAMAAVDYRLDRADWNLLEHQAPYERAIILPGDSAEVVMRIEKSGTWMYMCMFPYHMQFGMMGMMMTEGASMGAGSMGGMKM